MNNFVEALYSQIKSTFTPNKITNKIIRNHYDNLKVSRNAPTEVIKAAYKALAQKYHPDRNSNNIDASKNMAIINDSYSVLSDPIKRKEHDSWIIEQESVNTKKNTNNQNSNTSKSTETTSDSEYFIKIILHVARHWVLYGIALLAIFLNLNKNPSQHQKPYSDNPAAEIEAPSETSEAAPPAEENVANGALPGAAAEAEAKYKYDESEIQTELNKIDKKYSRSTASQPLEIETYPATPSDNLLEHAPNGEDWPVSAGYVKGYKKLNTNGLSSVTVDNSQNDSNVYVKLVSLSGVKSYPARQFFIPANGKFTVNKVTSGNYDVRYRDLSDGGLSRSESFNLKETKNGSGVQFSNITMTLYKVKNGNMQTYGLSETEF